jgi:hypothetical protein
MQKSLKVVCVKLTRRKNFHDCEGSGFEHLFRTQTALPPVSEGKLHSAHRVVGFLDLPLEIVEVLLD